MAQESIPASLLMFPIRLDVAASRQRPVGTFAHNREGLSTSRAESTEWDLGGRERMRRKEQAAEMLPGTFPTERIALKLGLGQESGQGQWN